MRRVRIRVGVGMGIGRKGVGRRGQSLGMFMGAQSEEQIGDYGVWLCLGLGISICDLR